MIWVGVRGKRRVGGEEMKQAAIGIAHVVYWLGHIATFVKLTFLDGYQYTWWNWIIALPVNEFLAMIWPIYWLILRPLFRN
jgi:hypothetical protein